jgi:hypothetical protein
MQEDDMRIFQEAFALYNRFRWRKLEDEDFVQLFRELSEFAAGHDFQNNPLAFRISMMIFDVFNDLYGNGKVPVIPDYFGRSDL